MEIICLDLEGVLVPEIWIEMAARTGIEGLRLTTKDVADYDELMNRRLAILDEHGLGLPDIQAVIGDMAPLTGAREFLGQLRERYQVVVLSDTFYEFADPLMKMLDRPTLFCHHIDADPRGRIVGYRSRLKDHKRQSVIRFQSLNFKVMAAGDSLNDTDMLAAADLGILFCPPKNVIEEFPQFPVIKEYDALQAAFAEAE